MEMLTISTTTGRSWRDSHVPSVESEHTRHTSALFLEEAVKAVRLKTTEAALLGRYHQDDAEDLVDPEALVGY